MPSGWGASETPQERRTRQDLVEQAKRDKARRKHTRQVEKDAKRKKKKC